MNPCSHGVQPDITMPGPGLAWVCSVLTLSGRAYDRSGQKKSNVSRLWQMKSDFEGMIICRSVGGEINLSANERVSLCWMGR